MDDTYYDEGTTEQDKPADESESMDSTGLLPKGFFVGKEPKPGDICTIEITKVYDDQVEVKYLPHDQEESGEGEAMAAPMGDDSDMMS